jgi:flagellar basal-body rod protein FlgB
MITANLGEVTKKKNSDMSESILFRKVFHALESTISITHQRHNYIASNISNIDTSNYKPRDIDFQSALARAIKMDGHISLSRTHPGHMEVEMNPEGPVKPFEEEGEWNGYNWVNIDREMVKLMENNLVHRTAVELLLRKIVALKEVIREGGR